jgi:hypothetical protein
MRDVMTTSCTGRCILRPTKWFLIIDPPHVEPWICTSIGSGKNSGWPEISTRPHALWIIVKMWFWVRTSRTVPGGTSYKSTPPSISDCFHVPVDRVTEVRVWEGRLGVHKGSHRR